MSKFYLMISIFYLIPALLLGQLETLNPIKVQSPEAFMTTIPLSEMEIVPVQPVSDWKNGMVPNKGNIPPIQKLGNNKETTYKFDNALQKSYKKPLSSPETIGVNFEGVSNTYGVAPPDTDGDVGTNHYIQMVNLGFQIFDKSGAALTSPAALSTIWQNLPGPWVGNYGDPIVLYDEIDDRWFLSQFSLPNYPNGPFYMLIAVSATSDPLGSYHLYAYSFTNMPDYPKFGVWPDGYYMSINQFANGTLNWAGAGAAAFERSEMLNGNTAEMVLFTFSAAQDPWSFLPADFDGTPPPVGTPNYFAYIDYWSGIDRLRIYEFDVDWATPSNSTFSGPFNVNTASFNATATNVPQSGVSQTLDVIDDRLMYRLQYRNFGTYQTLVTNHTVDAGSGRAGVRWYELRKTTGNWSMHQQGTYAPNDGLYRWMASVAMNGNGDIGIGFSISSSGMNPAIRFAGRNAGDPLGQITLPEETIFAGTASQSGVSRWGDYSALSIDPSDDATFWYTQEYSNGSWNWKTRIASFTLEVPPLTADFSGSPTTVETGNTVQFNDMSVGGATSWTWSFPGGTPSSYSGQTPPPILYNSLGTYDVSLTVSDGVDTHTETKINYINVIPFSYCIPTYTYGTGYGDYISLVQLEDINNATGASSSPYYNYYSSMSAQLLQGESYTITLSPGTYSSGNYIAVWIDYNYDGNFSEATEKLGTISIAPTPATGTITFTVPEDAVTGTTRMRVREVWNNSNFDACSNYGYGETEDYKIEINGSDLRVSVNAMLEGPFNGSGMNSDLQQVMPLSQPFNAPPWNYSGTESVGSIPNGEVVDWILIDIRDAASSATAGVATSIARRAGFVLTDGSVVDLDGTSDITFPVTIGQNLYLALLHRNHLSVLSNNPLVQSDGIYTYDFSTGINQAYGGSAAHKQLAPGIWGMISGDGNADGVINDSDKSTLWNIEAGTPGYLPSDYNLDGQSNNIDKDDFWLPNVGESSQVPD